MTPKTIQSQISALLILAGAVGLFTTWEASQPNHRFEVEDDFNRAIQQFPDWLKDRESEMSTWVDTNFIENNCWPIPQNTELCNYWNELYPPEESRKYNY